MKKEFNLEELFNKAKESRPAISGQEAIDRFTKSATIASKRTKLKRVQSFIKKNGVMMVTAIAVSIGIFFSIPSNITTEESQVSKNEGTSYHVSEKVKRESKSVPLTKKQESEALTKKKDGFSIPPLSVKEISAIYVDKFDVMELYRGVKISPKPTIQSTDPKYYPKLTPDEIKENHKQKKKMLKALSKFDKKAYAYVPSGSMKIGDRVTSVQAFYMGVNEVTNLEYRTFMFDLIIQGRKSDFDVARPDQAKWSFFLEDSVKSMENSYFSHPAFDNYPVVNITKEGAELYCKWLTTELIKVYGNEFNDVRIPVKDEWIFAASAGGKAMPFPWGNDSIKNETGCFLANFDVNSDFPKNGSITLGQDGAMFTAKVGTYNPNDRGLYNISGNVAELAYDSKRDEKGRYTMLSTLVQCGGGWMDSADELKIDAEKKPFVAATPNVGFRVVMTYMSPLTH